MYACLAVTCHLHFWQNDRDFLRATAVTRGWNGYRNKSQHRKSTLEKKILPPFQQGFEPATFQSRVRHSNRWAIPAPIVSIMKKCAFILKSVLRNCRKLHFKTLGFLCELIRQPTIYMNKELCFEARGWKLFWRYPNTKIVWCDTVIVCLFLGALFSILDFHTSLCLFMHLPSFCPAIL